MNTQHLREFKCKERTCTYHLKGFGTNSERNRHEQTHDGEPHYKCKFCGRVGSRKHYIEVVHAKKVHGHIIGKKRASPATKKNKTQG